MSNSKFYSKSLTLLLPLLKMISDGYTATEIAKALHASKSLVSYYIQKAKVIGYVTEGARDVFKPIMLTQAGQNFLDQSEHSEHSEPICRAENIIFKAEVLEMSKIPLDWTKIQMHNWVQYNSKVDSVHVKLNMGNKPTVELIPSPVDGHDPNQLFVTLVYDCISVITALRERFGIKLGRLQLSSRPEWVVYDPVAKNFSKYNGQVTINGLGKVNASKPRRIGEFEFSDPRTMADYMAMPRRLCKVEQSVEQILKILNETRDEMTTEDKTDR